METLFTKIINGEIPCYKIAENEQFFAFLDISPLAKGHTLVIPKEQEDYIFNLDDKTIAELMVFAKKIAKAIEENVTCQRIGVAVIGLEVPHTHIHLVPINHVSDLNFKNERVQISKEEMANLAILISSSVKL
ncbi:MAG: HIT family protein [Bacteroidetes bacterium HGW-Bacteroidetes-20]|nr:MAG: HIT family protein [Bacteroidetes bacterium HGW-Bacteroidetes-20]